MLSKLPASSISRHTPADAWNRHITRKKRLKGFRTRGGSCRNKAVYGCGKIWLWRERTPARMYARTDPGGGRAKTPWGSEREAQISILRLSWRNFYQLRRNSWSCCGKNLDRCLLCLTCNKTFPLCWVTLQDQASLMACFLGESVTHVYARVTAESFQLYKLYVFRHVLTHKTNYKHSL